MKHQKARLEFPHETIAVNNSQEKLHRYGPGELPVEYIPLNEHTLKPGDIFGPISFKISVSSHRHHMEYLTKCNTVSTGIDTAFLYPFEFWPLPRVMSQWYFGRLNEVISIRAERIIYSRPATEQNLIGETVAKKITKRGGLCFGFFESITKSDDGIPLMAAKDVLLLANGCNQSSLREAVHQIKNNKTFAFIDNPSSVLGSWILQMRFPWPEDKWLNNIHTDVYARSLGYESGLVEGPGIVDVILSIDQARQNDISKFRLSWKYMGPLYSETSVVLIADDIHNKNLRKYSVCEAPKDIPGRCRVLLTMEVDKL